MDTTSNEDNQCITDDGLIDICNDVVGARYLRLSNSVCFLKSSVFTVEVMLTEYNRPEVRKPS